MILWVVLGVLAVGTACVLYGVLVEHHWFKTTRYRLAILPSSTGGGLSILHLSDLHFLARDLRKERFLGELPRADVAIVTGDIIGEPEAVEGVARALDGVRGRLASYFVLGSNDYYRPQPLNYFAYFTDRQARRRRIHRSRDADLVAQLEARGWVHLNNVRREIELDGLPVELLGLDDPHIHRHDLRVAPRRSQARFGLAVVHSPDPAPELAALGYDLIVAGHTHGGQVRLPGVGALVTNSQMPRSMAMGLHRVGASYLHVSPGLGTSKYAPFRFLCRPQATVIELVPERAQVPAEATRSRTAS